MFPDVAERLALAHLAKGDQMSALITGGGCWLVLFSQPSTCASFCWIGQPCCSTAMQSITKPSASSCAPRSHCCPRHSPSVPRSVLLHTRLLCAHAAAHPTAHPTHGAGEWYMRNSHFPGWGRPYEFNSQLMARVGRAEEARDVVSTAGCWLSR